jgi:hypothetical protein
MKCASSWVALLAVSSAAPIGAPQQPTAPRPPTTETQAHVALRVLVPAYFYPVPNSPWNRLMAAASAHPGRVVAIGNPASGPGSSLDPTYYGTFLNFRAAGGRLIGYVHTSYGARPIAQVKADVDAWYAMYPVQGIFVDEMDNVPGAHESYYRDLFTHVRSIQGDALVVGNPGTSTAPSYLVWQGKPVVSSLCIEESSSNFLAWSSDPWVKGVARRHIYALPYGVGAAAWQAVVDHAYAQNCGFVYVTDDVLPNPWDTLPAYFESMVAHIDATY